MQPNFNSYLFRCSGVGQIMGRIGLTEAQKAKLNELSDRKEQSQQGNARALTANMEQELRELLRKESNPEVPDTIDKYLTECYIEWRYKRSKKLENKYITKGLEVEEKSLTLYDKVYNKLGGVLIQNQDRLSNEYITGKPDVFRDGTIIDLKSSWDLFTYFNATSYINMNYYWQLQGYMALTGKLKSELAYCLIDTPLALIHDEQRRLQWKMNAMDNDPEYIKACEEIEFNHQYPDIPDEQRIQLIKIERNEKDIQFMYERIKFCRNYVNEKFNLCQE